MKKFKLLTAMAVAALTVVFASFALVGCGEKDYSFEAENADITIGKIGRASCRERVFGLV